MDETYANKIDNLSVKMDAQFDIHERYTDAFLQVATDIRMVSKRVEGLHKMSEEEARDVYRQLLAIAHEVSRLEKNIDGLKSDLREQVAEYREIAERFTEELARHRDLIGPQINEVAEAVDDASDAQRDADAKLAQKIDEVLAASKKTLVTVAAIQGVVGSLDESDENAKPLAVGMARLLDALRRLRGFLWGLGIVGATCSVLWGLWQALLQLGFLEQKWPWSK